MAGKSESTANIFKYVADTLHPKGGWDGWFGSSLLQGSEPSAIYLFALGFATLVVLVLAFLARRGYDAPKREAMLPDEGVSVRNLFDAVLEATFDLMADLMGRENAERYFPLIATLSVFIFISNLLGLLPGMVPPTQNLNMTIAMSVSVFIYYNIVGISHHGLEYFGEFTGPNTGLNVIVSLGMSVLFFVIEVIGHLARPTSLAVRLSGNMTADHQVLASFGRIGEMTFGGPLFFPIPILFLGLIIAIIQTLVFALLSAIYIQLAIEQH